MKWLLFFIPTLLFAERYEINVNYLLVEKSKEIMIKQVGTKETGFNRGAVEKYWRTFSKSPIPYCAAGQWWCFNEASKELKIKNDLPKSALANYYFDYAKRNGVKTDDKPRVNDFIIWKKDNSSKGHIERIIEVKERYVRCVGFNTGSDAREGDGVWFTKRATNGFLSKMRLRGYVGFR